MSSWPTDAEKKLDIALRENEIDRAKRLLTDKIPIDRNILIFGSPLAMAIRYGCDEIIEFLIFFRDSILNY